MIKDKNEKQDAQKRKGISADIFGKISSLEIILRMCELINVLSDIVKKQQIIIEQSKIEEAVEADFWKQVDEAEREQEAIEYYSRKFCDTYGIEATFGKETAIDD